MSKKTVNAVVAAITADQPVESIGAPQAIPVTGREITPPVREGFAVSSSNLELSSLHSVTVAAALAATFGLGWGAEWGSHHFLAKQNSCFLDHYSKSSVYSSAKADRESPPRLQENEGKFAPRSTEGLRRGNEPLHGTDQKNMVWARGEHFPTYLSASMTDRDVTQSWPKVPETRPTTIDGWRLREVVGGKVVLEGPNGIFIARRGDTVTGIGRIDSIVRWGDRWIVASTQGLISTQD